MKRCPTCESSYADEDDFCELDGTRLKPGPAASRTPSEGEARSAVSPAAASAPNLVEAAREAARQATTIVPASACPSCGAVGSDDGDGYCSACGHRIDARATVSILPPGATIGEHEVKDARAPDDVLATTKSGAEVAIAIGDAALLADEAAATRALAGHRAVPNILGSGKDERRGAYLVLSAPADAKFLLEVAPRMDLRAAIALAREVLDIVAALERAGFRWIPRQTDMYFAGGSLALSRVRAARLEGAIADACCPVAVCGRAFVPTPAVHGTAALFRLLAGAGLDAPHPVRGAVALRAELDAIERELAGPPASARDAATECDRGLKRDHNEDAVALATGETRGEPWTVLVVCDGVSCSTHAEQASSVAAKTACDALAHFARSGDIAHEAAPRAMAAAIRAAHVAVCSAQIEHGTKEPPGTTIVAGLVYRRRLTVGWVGDSRAYWIGKGGSELLTRDHSWAQEAVQRGEMTEDEAMRQPLAHALTRCLGPLEAADGESAVAIEPEVRARDLPGPGFVVLCSDGLWNYFPEARAIAELVHAAGGEATPHAVARRLVNHALHRGGGDNVSVAIYAHAQLE